MDLVRTDLKKQSNTQATEATEIRKSFIVGVGASAGGLNAIKSFFSQFPTDSGMTFVVIQHLSPDFDSLMDELLCRHTSLAVQKVEQPVTIRPNHIYLIPPRKDLTIKGTLLIPSDQDLKASLKHPIDHFFESLAAQYGKRAVGVILSGTGYDGTKGCRAIHEAGGVVIAQSPDSAQFSGMPQSIIRQGYPDIVDRPENMADRMIALAAGKHPRKEVQSEQGLSAILSKLGGFGGLDFHSYRISTVRRRVERRMRLHQISSFQTYSEFLDRNETELSTLHSELLIGVTSFFRDEQAFECFRKEVVPKVCALAKESGNVRVWVPGCATGEEPYSIAMCLLEHLTSENLNLSLKVFATDVDQSSLDRASLGRYLPASLKALDPMFIEKNFRMAEGLYEVKPGLRRAVIFSYHDVTQDPPFTKLHLISCRNVLIYFQPKLQSKAIEFFRFGLLKRGILFLGKSECVGDADQSFESLNQEMKFFRKKSNAPYRNLGLRRPVALPASESDVSRSGARRELSPRNGLMDMYESLLQQYLPPCLIVDDELQLLHTFGNANEVLEFPVGRLTMNLRRLLPTELSSVVARAVAKLEKPGDAVSLDRIESSLGKVDIRAQVLSHRSRGPKLYVVTFEPCSSKDGRKPHRVNVHNMGSFDATRERIHDLEAQLETTKESLNSTIEQLETTNEELQSTNEELTSSNEELQSSNEELHSVN